MTDSFAQARQLFLDGVSLFEAGRHEEAAANFEAALVLVPGRVSTLVNLAATRIGLGRHDAALPLLDQALASAPDDADAWMHRGNALNALRRYDESLACHARVLALAPGDAQAWLRHGQALQYVERHDEALASYERALSLDAGLAQAWTNRANILKHRGLVDEAAAAFRRAIALGGDAALNHYYLAALTGDSAPRTPPRAYVERLFDDYAETFDAHLVGQLGYRAHRLLLEPLQAQRGEARFRHALDLGCGTGLCGPLIKAMAERVDGIDLSAAMLAKARATGIYERLEQADLAEHLAQTDQRHDLVVAADVFIYVGALEAVFSGVQRVLEPGGAFCLSAEQASGDADFELLPSLRYAHSEPYLRSVAAQAGFEVERLVSQPIREDQRRPIPGLYAYLRRV
jgi:predicted TPR repeat methyltransferase